MRNNLCRHVIAPKSDVKIGNNFQGGLDQLIRRVVLTLIPFAGSKDYGILAGSQVAVESLFNYGTTSRHPPPTSDR